MAEGDKPNLINVVSTFNRDEKEREVQEKASELGVGYLDVRKIELAPENLSLISKEEAQKGIIPLTRKGDRLALGVADANRVEAKQAVAYLSKFFKVEPTLISWDSVKDALPHYEGLVKQVLERPKDYEVEAMEQALTFKELENQLNSAPLQEILKFIVSMAIQANSSDVHLEPDRGGARVRFRIDGVLHIVGRLTDERFKYILSQIELSSGLKLNLDEAQEGRLEVKLSGKNISVRVETMPTLYGDDISLRIFNTEAAMLTLDKLGLNDYSLGALKAALARPQGMVLVVGPTGSGKTSTIYAILNVLNQPEVKIITLEDPIEYALPGITQSQIDEKEGFLERLKAVLREDPDIVMLGEIRDGETADVALHAALTGHLMISTFHANNATTALGLLKEISGNNKLLASAINLLVAQRLVRRLCDKCKEEVEPKADEKEFAERVFAELDENTKAGKNIQFFKSKGCEDCGNLGFKGRVGIFEMLPLSIELQKMISREDITVSELQEAAKKSGMVTMEQDGLLKAISGITSVSEVMKAIKE